MKLDRYFIFLFITLLWFSCDSRDFKEGFDRGYKKGWLEGGIEADAAGYARGKKDGYEQGYVDASKGKVDYSVFDVGLRESVSSSRKIFTLVFFFVNVGALAWLIGYLIFLKKEEHTQIKIAKIAYLLMSTAIAYLSISAFSINNLAESELKSLPKVIIVILVAPLTFGISLVIRKFVMKLHVVYSDVLAIFFSTFVLTYFIFFAFNLKLFLLHNEFTSYCVISLSVGGLGFAGYSMIEAYYKMVR